GASAGEIGGRESFLTPGASPGFTGGRVSWRAGVPLTPGASPGEIGGRESFLTPGAGPGFTGGSVSWRAGVPLTPGASPGITNPAGPEYFLPMHRTTRPLRGLALLLLVPAALAAQQASFTLDQVMSPPFPDELVAAPAVAGGGGGGAVAWVFNARGTRNVWVAAPPDYRGKAVTS